MGKRVSEKGSVDSENKIKKKMSLNTSPSTDGKSYIFSLKFYLLYSLSFMGSDFLAMCMACW